MRSAALLGPITAATAILLALPPLSVAGQTVLRVGLTDGSQPCSYREAGAWRGLAVDLWERIAREEQLPYVIAPQGDLKALLEAVRRGEVDAAVGCLNVSPERLRQLRFTLPFQEGGQAVLVARNRLEVGKAMLLALLSPDLLRLLGGYLAATALVAVALWRIEGHAEHPDTQKQGRRRSFARVFQILATGPGTNTIALTTRGHSLVVLSYLIRITVASLLVSAITLNVVRQPQETAALTIRTPADLAGRRVAARAGSVSEELLQELNSDPARPPVRIVVLPRVQDADRLLRDGRADAVLADELQLQYLMRRLDPGRYELVLRGIRTESQAFALAPGLSQAIAQRINLRISVLKRSGAVAELRAQELRPETEAAAAARSGEGR